MRSTAPSAGSLAVLLLVAAPAGAQPPPRAEVPIVEVRLSDGVLRYGVPVTIDGKEALAGLDTGASGLRLMPDAPGRASAKTSAKPEHYSFGSGAQLHGTGGQVRISIGGLSGDAAVHLVDRVDCIARSPNCPGRLGLGYGFLGDGLPKEGFRVLLGGNMGRTSIDNPLTAVGARRWIIELPRPGEAGSGRLILNPTDAEVAGFILVRLTGGFSERDGGGLHDGVWGCLRNVADTERACGVTAMDTGAAFIRVNNAPPRDWPKGTPLVLDFKSDGATVAASMALTVGAPAQNVRFTTAPIRGTAIQAGVAPYYAFTILYDPGRRVLGFSPRPPSGPGASGAASAGPSGR